MSDGAKLTVWIVVGLLFIGGCVSNGGSSSKPSTVSPSGGSSSGSSSYCETAGKKKFTSFSDSAWKDYVAKCAP